MSATQILPNFQVIEILSGNGPAEIYSLAQGKIKVIDFWTTKCVKCPAALSKLDDLAPLHGNAAFFSCVLQKDVQDQEVAKDVIDGSWENMIHLFVDIATKEELKATFNFKEVPFCVIVGEDHRILASGNPKDINIEEVLRRGGALLEVPPTAIEASGRLVLDEDF